MPGLSAVDVAILAVLRDVNVDTPDACGSTLTIADRLDVPSPVVIRALLRMCDSGLTVLDVDAAWARTVDGARVAQNTFSDAVERYDTPGES